MFCLTLSLPDRVAMASVEGEGREKASTGGTQRRNKVDSHQEFLGDPETVVIRVGKLQ